MPPIPTPSSALPTGCFFVDSVRWRGCTETERGGCGAVVLAAEPPRSAESACSGACRWSEARPPCKPPPGGAELSPRREAELAVGPADCERGARPSVPVPGGTALLFATALFPSQARVGDELPPRAALAVLCAAWAPCLAARRPGPASKRPWSPSCKLLSKPWLVGTCVFARDSAWPCFSAPLSSNTSVLRAISGGIFDAGLAGTMSAGSA